MCAVTWALRWSPDMVKGVDVVLGIVGMALGVGTLFPGQSMSLHIYEPLLRVGPEALWGFAQLIAGFAQWLAAMINGAWLHSPIPRILGSLVNMMVFVALTMLFFQNSSNEISRAAVLYGALSIVCFLTILKNAERLHVGFK